MANYAQYVNNPNVRRFLDLLSQTEGSKGYEYGFGNRKLESLASHPRTMYPFKNNRGETKQSSAAGRYQINLGTWNEFAKAAGVNDFGPNSQDQVAIAIIDKEGALDDIVKGDFNAAVNKLGNRWASLPSSNYAQPKRSWGFVNKALGQAPSQAPAQQPMQQPNVPFNTFTKALSGLPLPLGQMMQAPPTRQGFDPVGQDYRISAEDIGNFANDVANLLPRQAANTPSPQPQQDWRDLLPTQQPLSTPVSQDDVSWEDKFLHQAMNRDAYNNRQRAIAAITGQPYREDMALPKPIERTISQKVSEL